MAYVILSTDIDTARAEAWFAYAGYHIRDAREPLRNTFYDVVLPAVKGQFETRGARSGDPWEPLSTEYDEWKQRYYSGQPILELTGDMKKDVFYTPPRITQHDLDWKIYNDYIEYHQEGGYVEGRPPQRIIVALTVDDYDEIDDIFTGWLEELRFDNRRRPNFSDDVPSAPDFYIPGA